MRVVASFTTIPSRLPFITPVLQSLVNQTHQLDQIYLTVAFDVSHFNDVSKEMKILMERGILKIVRIQKDYGPVCKIFGPLIMETDENVRIFYCDDDVEYSPTAVEQLLFHSIRKPHLAFGFGAFNILPSWPYVNIHFGGISNPIYVPKPFQISFRQQQQLEPVLKPVSVQYLMGTSGVMVCRGFFLGDWFDQFVSWSMDEQMRRADDVTISSYLNLQGVKRYLVPFKNENFGQDLGLCEPLSSSWFHAINNHLYTHEKLSHSNNIRKNMLWNTIQVLLGIIGTILLVFVIILFH